MKLPKAWLVVIGSSPQIVVDPTGKKSKDDIAKVAIELAAGPRDVTEGSDSDWAPYTWLITVTQISIDVQDMVDGCVAVSIPCDNSDGRPKEYRLNFSTIHDFDDHSMVAASLKSKKYSKEY